jgi:E3 ubiquitin-protein ligase MYLIP
MRIMLEKPYVLCLVAAIPNKVSFIFQAIKARLEKYEDSMLCRVCMAEEINTAFIPCGHLICCLTCSNHVEHCPICRSDIENIQQIYMPMSWR